MNFSVLDQISQNLTTKKVGIEEFCESSDYCGKRLYPRQRLLLKLIFLEELSGQEEDILNHWISGGRDGTEIIISPLIRERINYLRDTGYPHFREIVLVGGRRSSKGFITALAMAKRMFDTLQYQDPGTHYGVDPEKEIYYSCIAASQDQAKKFQYADFSSTVARCGAMEQNITKLQELEFSVATDQDKMAMDSLKKRGLSGGRTRDISKLRGVALAANASTVRGSATQAVCLDEMAWMQQVGESGSTAEAVYDAIMPALGQFGRDSLIFCNSSPYTKLGKFYQRYEEGLKVQDGKPLAPLMFTFQFPSWALFEGWQDDPKKARRKAISVSPDWDPEEKRDNKYYHSAHDRDQIVIMREEERQDPDKFKVERRGQFAEIIDAFLRPEAVDRAYMGVPVLSGGYKRLSTNWSSSSYHFSYKAHLDPSSTTAGFGFALAHVEELEDLDGGMRSHVVFDIVKRWVPGQFSEGVVDWEKVLHEVVGYIDLFEPYEVTFDQFQSQAPIQWLNRWLQENNMSQVRVYEKPATAQYNWNRAEVFRTALYQDLVHLPADTQDAQWCGLELKNLQQINTAGRYPRVDKQEIGPVQTKDMADCVMETVEALIGNLIANETRSNLDNMPVELGALGGYPIGGTQDGRMSDLYSGRAGTHTFREQKKGSSSPLNDRTEQTRDNLNRLSAARSGTWSSRPGRGSRGFR
jgi:hypothetical protein